MAERETSLPTQMADAVRRLQDELVPRVAELMRPVLGNVPVSKEERRQRWWQEDNGWTPERELALLTGLGPDGAPLLDANGRPTQPLTREDVGLLKYPHREIDARAAGRGDVRREAEYAKEMSDLGPPSPDPLAAAAQAVQAPEPTGGRAPS